MSSLRRRRGLLVASLATTALVLAAACAPGEGEQDAIASDGEVSVGFIAPLTGVVAVAGKEMQEGWDLYWKLNGNKVGDLTVKTIVEDDAGNPDTSLTKAKRLVEQENVDLIVGPLLANTALAVSAYTAEVGVPNLHPISAADDITQRLRNDLTLRSSAMTGSQMNFPAGDWAYKQGHRTAVTLCPDYAFGWESCGGFSRVFTESGGEVVERIWYPLGTQDFSTYITQIQNAGADIAFIGAAGGADGPNIFKTFNSFGLKGKQAVLTNCCVVDQSTLRTMGAEVEGVNSVSYFTEGADNPAVKEFTDAYEKAYGRLPSLNDAGGWGTAAVLARALENLGSDFTGEELIAAAKGLTFEDSIYGKISYDEYNNMTAPVSIREVVQREDGTWWNVPIETYDEVSQFWTWDPKKYLEGPNYSRDFQG
ncbi:ABC transporter substrate-binding protein [Georgenia sp. SYP-B2076]|uniref:ABC transporter substrate-binding protein n=1 Tax=Georgenia sp. SYP-B2076 TaxID=2495881 RepID=UPI000F8F5B77|nr:ABC transporter substrate-binding protein [Georgenia sp. SYP-B2076]